MLHGLAVSIVGIVAVFVFLWLLVAALWLMGRLLHTVDRPSEQGEGALAEVAAVIAVALARRRTADRPEAKETS